VSDDVLHVARAAVVREHMDSENRHAFNATIGTFSHPRYELIATGEVFDAEPRRQRDHRGQPGRRCLSPDMRRRSGTRYYLRAARVRHNRTVCPQTGTNCANARSPRSARSVLNTQS